MRAGVDGTLIYASDPVGVQQPGESLVWVDRRGEEEIIAWLDQGFAIYGGFAVDRSGRRIAASWRASRRDSEGDVWFLNLDERSRFPPTHDGASVRPRWHPTENRIAYVHYEESGRTAVRSISADGSGEAEHLVYLADEGAPPEVMWSHDGGELLLRMSGSSQRSLSGDGWVGRRVYPPGRARHDSVGQGRGGLCFSGCRRVSPVWGAVAPRWVSMVRCEVAPQNHHTLHRALSEHVVTPPPHTLSSPNRGALTRPHEITYPPDTLTHKYSR